MTRHDYAHHTPRRPWTLTEIGLCALFVIVLSIHF